jgi:hypothetical protein
MLMKAHALVTARLMRVRFVEYIVSSPYGFIANSVFPDLLRRVKRIQKTALSFFVFTKLAALQRSRRPFC